MARGFLHKGHALRAMTCGGPCLALLVGNCDRRRFYASYRMARLGVIVMDMCRPIPFRDEDVPSITGLVGNVIRQRTDTQ